MDSVPPQFFFVGNSSIKRPFLDSVGRFDERYRVHTFDDFELGLRLRVAGMTAEFVSGVGSEHHHPITMKCWSHVVRQTAASARQFDQGEAATSEWQPVVGRSAWNHRMRAYSRLLRFRVAPSPPGPRSATTTACCTPAFSAGYRRAAERELAPARHTRCARMPGQDERARYPQRPSSVLVTVTRRVTGSCVAGRIRRSHVRSAAVTETIANVRCVGQERTRRPGRSPVGSPSTYVTQPATTVAL